MLSRLPISVSSSLGLLLSAYFWQLILSAWTSNFRMYTLNQVTSSIADINTAGMRKGGKAEGRVEPIITIEQARAVSFGDAEFFFFGFRAI